MIDDKKFVDILFKRIGHLLPQTFQISELADTYNIKEINERLRFLRYICYKLLPNYDMNCIINSNCRYDPGDKFKPHNDGSYTRPDNSARTWITLQLYLNEGMGGGETTFLKVGPVNQDVLPQDRVPVKPKTGSILVFQHNILHEGSEVTSGQKYTIRMDVLYERNKAFEEYFDNNATKKWNCNIV